MLWSESTLWLTTEGKGCVFLPAAGYRNGIDFHNVGYYGEYWSSTADSSTTYNLLFNSSKVDPQSHFYRHGGFSVRLVR